ncbi:FecR family protein [Piscinibacter sakaiensis]|uniref:LysM domain-containing protein n=1 Tax=Piscinibacter sakaiensis TaxID=1547922 RepID=A0A0K8P1Q4_PISS1|nr:FecR domain-containing protein [Piscinibacter sakaiensis]GAP36553.1 hypothetical protein ISF6_2393 [Piscinibacter sakaiensis]
MTRRAAGLGLALIPAVVVCAALAGPPTSAPPAAAAPAAATAAPGDEAPLDYTTRPGDTLIGLSARLLADPGRWRELARVNGLANPHRIAVGQALRIPLDWLRSEPATATVIGVAGRASLLPDGALQVGQAVAEGRSLQTGADGNLTVRLVDGTVLRLRADSRLELSESRRLPSVGGTRSGTRLDAGRVEIKAGTAGAGLPGFRVRTPQGVLAVRGTAFRVEVATDRATTRGEVLEGTVAFSGQPVTAGHGSAIDADGRVAPASPLAPAPDLAALPGLQQRLLVRFALPRPEGVRAWRAQVAVDASFDTVLADLTTAGAELRFADLPDGDYLLRVRAIDPQGWEGYDADHRFRLKARPEAPLPSSPAPGAVLSGERVSLAWAAHAEAGSYRLQIAGDAGFEAPLRDLADLGTPGAVVDGLAPGRYRWRLRSVRPGGDAGPWGDARGFEIRPPPPNPPPPRIGDESLSLAWEGQPGQRFDVQLARDPAFTQGVASVELDRPAVELPLPGSGRFWVRLRVRDPDGFIGPWTAPQSVDVPHCLRDGSGRCVRAGDGIVDTVP